MTIPNQTARTGPYNGNGSTTVFAYDFRILDQSHVVVTLKSAADVETVQTLTTNYTVSGVGESTGGNITMVVAPASGEQLTFSRSIPQTQEVDLANRGGVQPEILESAYDKLTQLSQDKVELLNRMPRFPVSSSLTGVELPLTLTANTALVVNAAGTGYTTGPTTSQISGAEASAAAAAASAADAATSYDNFDDRYLGQKSSDPSVDNDGGALLTGALYFNTSNNVMMVYTGSAWVRTTPTTGDQANIDAVTANATNINTVAGIAADVTTTAGIAANVTTVAGISTDVTTAATNVTDITNFADVYIGPSASDPTVRVDASALQAGDMYFNTTVDELRVYSGSQWVAGTAGTISVQRYSGDGSTVAFTLATAPASENNTQVYVSGVYQQKDTYGVSGTTLTFSAAPPIGTNNIEIVNSSVAAAYGGVAVDSFVDVTDYTSGTTTQLTLANDPGSKQNIAVTFDGITQHHATYSISGTTITFTSAIPIGTDNVEVRYNDSLVISVPADGSVTNAKMSYPLTGLTSQYHRVSGTPLGVDVASDIYATSVSDTNKELGLQVGMTAVKGKPNQTTAWNMAAQFSTICSDATSGTGSGDIYGINTVVHAPAGTLLVVGSEVDVNNTGADAETLGAATSAYSNVAVLGGTYIGTAAYYATTSNNTWKYGFAAKTTGVYKTKTLSYVTGWVERGLDLADGTFTTDIDSTTGLSQVVYANAGTQTIVLTGDTWHKDLSAGDTVRPIGSTSNNTLFTVVTRDSDTAITVTGGTVNETDAVPISRIVQTGVGIGVALPNRIPIVGTNNAGSAEVEIVKLNATDSVEFGAPTINPLQPAFSVQRSSSSGGVTGAGGAYQVVFNQENFDQDSSMTTTTFTAKIAGIYSFVARVHLIGLTAAADNMTLKIITSGSAVDPQYTEVNTNDLDTQQSIEVSGLLNLAVGDTAYVQLTVTGEANNTTVSVFGSAAVGYSSFTGYLVA